MHKRVCHIIGLVSQWVAAIYPTDHIAGGGWSISIQQWWVVKDFGRQCAFSPFVRSFENSTVFIFLKVLIPDRKPEIIANRKLEKIENSSAYVFALFPEGNISQGDIIGPPTPGPYPSRPADRIYLSLDRKSHEFPRSTPCIFANIHSLWYKVPKYHYSIKFSNAHVRFVITTPGKSLASPLVLTELFYMELGWPLVS